MTDVDLSLLTRRQLEDLLLTEHQALRRILAIVRGGNASSWRIRRDVDQVVDQARDRRPFTVAYLRTAERDLETSRATRNAAVWQRWNRSEP